MTIFITSDKFILSKVASYKKKKTIHASINLQVIDPKTLNRTEPYALYIGTQWDAKHTIPLDLFNIYPMINADNGVPTVGLQTLVDKNIPVIGKESRAGDKQPAQDISGISKKAYSDIVARIPYKYWIDPSGKEFQIKDSDHGSWIQQNRKLLEGYSFEFPNEYWEKSQGWFQIATTMIQNGWTRITTESDYDFAIEVADMNNLPAYLDNFVAKNYYGGGIEINDLNGNYQDLSDPFPSLKKAIYQAKRLRQQPVNASLNKNAGYDHAYWIDPNGKIFQVRGEDNDAMRRELDLSDEKTHSSWVIRNLDMLQKDYGIDPKSITGTRSLVELGWTRIGDAYGTDWGIDVANTDNIPSFVDDTIAQFAPEGSQITVAGPGSSRYQHSQSAYTFEWPVKSIQQTVQQLKNRQSQKLSPELQPAAKLFSKKEIVAKTYSNAWLMDPKGKLYPVVEDDHEATAQKLFHKSVYDLLPLGWTTIRTIGNNVAIAVDKLNRIPSTVDDFLAKTNVKTVAIIPADSNLEGLPEPPQVDYEDAIEHGIQKAVNRDIMRMRNRPSLASLKQAKTKKVKQGDYSCLMALVPHDLAQEIVEWGVRNVPDEDLYLDEDGKLGRELESHITIKYGLLTNDAKYVRRSFNHDKPFHAKLGKVRHFQPSELPFDVLTVEVISDDLQKANEKVCKEFDCAKGLVSDEYKPHITIAYMKRDKAHEYVGFEGFDDKEVELDTVIFSPHKGNRTYFSISNDKESSFILERLNKFGSMDVGYWVDPSGNIYDVHGAGLVHNEWVLANLEMLEKNYGIKVPKSLYNQRLKYYKNIEQDDNNVDMPASDTVWTQMIQSGWVRVGDADEGIGIEVNDLRKIPPFMDNILAEDLHDGLMVRVEDINHVMISVQYPFKNLQQAINQALVGQSKTAEFLPSLFQAPDNEWQFEHGGDDEPLTLNVKSFSSIPDYINDFILQHPAKEIQVEEMGHEFVRIPYEEVVSNGIQKAVQLAKRQQFKQASRGPIALWLAPDGEEFYIGQSSHAAWVESNKDLLKTKYNIDIETMGQMWPLIKSGWVRVDGYLPTELDLHLADINNIPQVAEQFVWKYNPETVIVEDLNHNDNSFDREEYSKGMMKHASGDNFLPSLVMPANNEWQFEHGGDDLEIALQPDSVNDDMTEYEPCTTGKPRTKEVWRQFISMFQNPFSKKEDMTINSDYDPEMDEKEKQEMGLSQTQLEYSKGFYDPKKHDFPHNTTWDSLTQDGEPSKPTSVTYSPQLSNDDNLDQNSPGGYPRRFMGKPKGEWFSDEGEIVPALQHMWKYRESALDNMTRDITASYGPGYWIDPSGKAYQVRGEDDLVTHRDWIERNKDLLVNDYGIEINNPDRFGYTYFGSKELVAKGWTRVGDSNFGYIGIDTPDLTHLPSSLNSILDTIQNNKGIILEDLSKAHVELSFSDEPFSGDIQKMVNKGLSQRRMGFSKKDLEKIAITRQYALYIGGRLAIRTLTRQKALKICQERFSEDFARGNYQIKEEAYTVASLEGSGYFISPEGKILKMDEESGHAGYIADEFGSNLSMEEMNKKLGEMLAKGWTRVREHDYEVSIEVADILNIPAHVEQFLMQYPESTIFLIDDTKKQHVVLDTDELSIGLQKAVNKALSQSRMGKQAGDQSASVPDYLINEWKTEQINDDVDEEPYVNHDQRDTSYGYHDSPEDTAFGIGWNKDNQPSVVHLDTLEDSAYRLDPFGIGSYNVIWYNSLPLTDGIEQGNPD